MNPQASDFNVVIEVRDSSVDPDADDVTDADIEKSFAEEGFCGRWSVSAVDDYRE